MKKLLLLLFTFSLVSLNAQDRETDSLALVDIYQTLNGENWSDGNNWLSSDPIDEWKEVTVVDDRVVKLRILSFAGASGEFPLALYNLTGLESLVMSQVEIDGSIPEGISALTKLRDLTLSSCGITGSIPSDIGQLVNLERIEMRANQLTGPLPELGPNVNRVAFHSNLLTGSIPESWATDVMRQVYLNNNQLTGSLDIFADMIGLDVISIFHNDWDAQPMPLWLDDLPILRAFQCARCNLEGDIPEYDFSNSPKLYQLILNDNSLTGDVANLFVSPTDDNIWLDVGNNLFEGELPTHLLANIGVLAVDYNNFSSVTAMNFEHVGRLDIVGNRLTISDLVEPLEPLLMDSINIYYGNQQAAEEDDTLIVNESMSIVLEARDDHADINYQWYRNNQAIDGATDYSYVVDVAVSGIEDRYECKMTHPLFVEDEDYSIEFFRGLTTVIADFPSAIEDFESKYEIVVSPNPAMEDFFIKSNLDLANASFTLTSTSGRELKSGLLSVDNRIDVSNLNSGLMILSILTKEGVISNAVLKK